ncbi:MAG: hypothetical protein AAB263_20430 [Planctomycetota bacterium]
MTEPPRMPKEFLSRWCLGSLTPAELISEQRKWHDDPAPVLLVRITGETLIVENKCRPGFDPQKKLDEKIILDRMDHYWALGPKIADWTKNPVQAPGLLLGIYGAPGNQIIIGSVKVNSTRWSMARRDKKHGYYVPVDSVTNQDVFELRGRRLQFSRHIKFNTILSQQFLVVDAAGKVHGGRSGLP